jgi:hypothetical protein
MLSADNIILSYNMLSVDNMSSADNVMLSAGNTYVIR